MTEKRASFFKTAAIILLICVFAASALLTAVLSAGVFNSISDRSNKGYFMRTNLLYIEQKIRAYDDGTGIRVDSFGGSDALVFVEDVNGTAYETWVYVDNGELSEVTVKSKSDVVSGAGQPINPVDSLSVEKKNGGLYKITLTDDKGDCSSATVFVRTEKEEGSL